MKIFYPLELEANNIMIALIFYRFKGELDD